MRIAVWLLATVLVLMLGAVVGLGWKPLITAKNPVAPSFGFGPLVGSITQSVDFGGGPIDTVTIWARSEGGFAAYADVHLLRAEDGPAAALGSHSRRRPALTFRRFQSRSPR